MGAAEVRRRDPHFAAALVVASEAFPLDNRVWRHVDSTRQHVDFDRILSNSTFTETERLLLEIAASLWSSTNHSTLLGVIADRLGDEGLAIVLRGLAAARDARRLASGHAPNGR